MLISMRTIVAIAAVTAALVGAEARSEPASPWKVMNAQRDPLTDQTARYAKTTPKSDPIQNGKPVTTALIIKCGTIYVSGPTHPELMILFTSLTGTGHVKNIETRYRFDEGPIRDYKLSSGGKAGARAILLPKLSNQDPIADLIAAKRLRVEVNLPHAGMTLLDFNVANASEAIQAISCK